MSEISKIKLHKLPYNIRLTLALKQNDYIEEIGKLFEDYPTYDHTIAQNELMKKCDTLKNMVRCFKLNFIDFPQLINTIAEQIICEYKIYFSFYGFYDLINRDVANGISKFNNHPYFQEAVLKIIISLLKCYHMDVDKNNDRSQCLSLISGYCRRFGIVPGITDEIAKQLIPNMYDVAVINIVQQLVKIGIHDEELRNLIHDSVNIQDIIT